MRHNFVLGEEYNEVVDICRLVEGMPLALELAAAWSKTMTCRTIAAEIRQNIDFLSTGCAMCPRHRSIQTIFDQSWQMLTADEQKYIRLSVFRAVFVGRRLSRWRKQIWQR
ncbi:hypothetical protein KFU94_40535 [Chloroflexi bacterium TSY]|nr:hypothetical protein [Chloroflexi bacterium TSY]